MLGLMKSLEFTEVCMTGLGCMLLCLFLPPQRFLAHFTAKSESCYIRIVMTVTKLAYESAAAASANPSVSLLKMVWSKSSEYGYTSEPVGSRGVKVMAS
jgi:hypothetical protein